jgi:predicted amidophosphoribosyltransferase
VLWANGKPTCFNCSQIEGFDRVYAVGPYYPVGETSRNLLSAHINGLKRFKTYADPLGEAMSLLVKNRHTELTSTDLVIPVPQHKDKYAERPFNQAEEIAQVVGRNLGLPVIMGLEKIKNESETGMGRADRLESVKGMYVTTAALPNLAGKTVMIIDDIVTVGATSAECSIVLKGAGARVVNVLVAGRTQRHSGGL